jgi:hypothetical protein
MLTRSSKAARSALAIRSGVAKVWWAIVASLMVLVLDQIELRRRTGTARNMIQTQVKDNHAHKQVISSVLE